MPAPKSDCNKKCPCTVLDMIVLEAAQSKPLSKSDVLGSSSNNSSSRGSRSGGSDR